MCTAFSPSSVGANAVRTDQLRPDRGPPAQVPPSSLPHPSPNLSNDCIAQGLVYRCFPGSGRTLSLFWDMWTTTKNKTTRAHREGGRGGYIASWIFLPSKIGGLQSEGGAGRREKRPQLELSLQSRPGAFSAPWGGGTLTQGGGHDNYQRR